MLLLSSELREQFVNMPGETNLKTLEITFSMKIREGNELSDTPISI